MWLALTIIAALALGWELAERWWPSGEPDRPEFSQRLLYGAVIGVALWQGSVWALALAHGLTKPLLLARTALFVLAAVVLAASRARTIDWNRTQPALHLAAYLPIAGWLAFAAWRAAVVPPANIDGLSYHLPKALLFARAGGFDALRDVRFLLSWRPSNYELLLGDGLVMAGSDAVTEWISVAFFACFIAGAVALGQRWWGRSPVAAAVTALLAGSIPVLLLHTTAYKNDVMVAFLMLGAFVALGRWWSDLDFRALCVAIMATAAAAGTKQGAVIFAAVILVVLVGSAVQRRAAWNRRRAALLASVAIASFVLLGGVEFIVKIIDWSRPAVPSAPSDPLAADAGYGYYGNLWKGPYVLATQSFSSDSDSFQVPWSPKPWPWRRYEMYYSELGVPFSLAAIAVLFLGWRLRGPRFREQVAITILALLSFLPLLPFDGYPRGRYLISTPRFALALAAVVFAWVIGPLVTWASARHRAAPAAAVVLSAVIFVLYAWKNAVYDTFVPLSYVLSASQRPGTRLPPLGYGRASAVVDEMAGPSDRIAFDGSVSSLVHLAYGARLQRPVDLIPPGSGAPRIASGVKWVAIDRSWNLIWGNRDFKDLADAQRFLQRGEATPADLRVYRAVAADPSFELVFFRPQSMQAVFRRR